MSILDTNLKFLLPISLIMRGCDIEDVQTCVDMSIPSSSVTCHIHSCNMSFVLYDQDAQMDAVKVDRGDSVFVRDQ